MVKREGMENLLLSYYEGETTEDETALVEEWLEASEENRRTARQVQTLGLAADMAQISSRLDVKKALEDVHRKMKQKKVNRYQVLFRGMQRAAAILFIPLMVSWSILYWDKDKEEIHMMEVRTNPGPGSGRRADPSRWRRCAAPPACGKYPWARKHRNGTGSCYLFLL